MIADTQPIQAKPIADRFRLSVVVEQLHQGRWRPLERSYLPRMEKLNDAMLAERQLSTIFAESLPLPEAAPSYQELEHEKLAEVKRANRAEKAARNLEQALREIAEKSPDLCAVALANQALHGTKAHQEDIDALCGCE